MWNRSMTAERFYANTKREGDCLIWQGNSRVGPYGAVGYRWQQWLAHRLSYFFSTGEHPGERVVRHRCDTPLCVEPTHLEIGSHQDNIRDKVERRRHRFGSTHPMRKLNADEVAEIRTRYAGGDVMQKELAKQYGVSTQQVSKIVRGEQWIGDKA